MPFYGWSANSCLLGFALLYIFKVAQGIGRKSGISCKMKERGVIEWIKI